jgi:hypothetical protein
MTCTHAAIKRKDLVDLGFQYDNLFMEEAAQIMEVRRRPLFFRRHWPPHASARGLHSLS